MLISDIKLQLYHNVAYPVNGNIALSKGSCITRGWTLPPLLPDDIGCGGFIEVLGRAVHEPRGFVVRRRIPHSPKMTGMRSVPECVFLVPPCVVQPWDECRQGSKHHNQRKDDDWFSHPPTSVCFSFCSWQHLQQKCSAQLQGSHNVSIAKPMPHCGINRPTC